MAKKYIDAVVDEDYFYDYDMTGDDLSHKEQNERNLEYFTQYSIDSGNRYRPTTKSVKKLPSGYYLTRADQNGLYFEKSKINIADLIRFPDSTADKVIAEFKTFWSKKKDYLVRGESHKRGFLLWGPPGGGKTCTVSFIIKDFIKKGNIIFEYSGYTLDGIRAFRNIESDRKIMIVIEDIDTYLKNPKEEQDLLQLLDGGIQHQNTIIISTTNYPEELPDRIINRPSRFDRISYIGLPNKKHRSMYIKKKSKNLKNGKINKWIEDTKGFTLAHIKELIVSVEVFGLDYNDSLHRLKLMRKKMSSSEDYEKDLRGHKDLGFLSGN